MAEFDAPRSSGKVVNILLSIAALVFIGVGIVLALKPELFSHGSTRIIDDVSISPQEAAMGGAQWRVVSQWQGSGEFRDEGTFYLVEFKPIPGWETPSPIVLRKGSPLAKVEGVYRAVKFSEQTICTLAGASTMAFRLAPELAEFYLRHIGADEVRRLPGKEADELTLQGIFYSTKEIKTINIAGKGTPSGFAALQSGDCDIALAAQHVSPAVAGDMAEMLDSPDAEYPVALDAVAVVVNRSNPVQQGGLTVDQVRQIFSGDITNWNQLGGESAPIKVLVLRDSFGTRTFFSEKFMGGKSFASTAREVDVHAQLSDLVAQDPQAIGFCSLAFVNQSREVPITAVANVAPVPPSPRTVRNRTYPAFRELYLYLSPSSKNVYARDFAMVCSSPAGQEIVRRFGFVGLHDEAEVSPEPSPTSEPSANAISDASRPANQTSAAVITSSVTVENATSDRVVNASTADASAQVGSVTDLPAALPELVQIDGEAVTEASRRKVYDPFRAAVQGAEHLPQIFRFELSSSSVGAQSLKDLDQVMAMMKAPERAGKKMILVGFSDSYGNYSSNQEISRRRAEMLASAVRAKGGEVAMVLGAGEENPLVSNAKRVGREQNRRVEIWVK